MNSLKPEPRASCAHPELPAHPLRPFPSFLQGDGKGDYCPSALLLHASQHWHPAGDGAAAAAAAGGAADGTTAAAMQQGQASSAAPAPCGSGSNRVYARESYPDGLPCSLWVMLRNEAAGGSTLSAHSAGSGNHSTPPNGQAAAAAAAAGGEAAAGGAVAAAGQPAGGEAAAAGQAAGGRARVVPWSRPDELAELLAKELQLE